MIKPTFQCSTWACHNHHSLITPHRGRSHLGNHNRGSRCHFAPFSQILFLVFLSETLSCQRMQRIHGCVIVKRVPTSCLAWFRRSLLSRPLLPIVHDSLQNRGKPPLKLALPQHVHFVTPSLPPKARVICPCWTFFSSTSSTFSCFKRCALLCSSHFDHFCFWCIPLLDLVSTFL